MSAEAKPALDLLVVGDLVTDAIVGDVGDVRFGQAETLVDSGVLTIGGSSAITACGAARLGLRVAFVGVVGDDMAGTALLRELAARGVDVSACVVLAGRATGLTVHLVREGPQRDRAMVTALGCAAELTPAMVPDALVRRSRHVHVGSFFLLSRLAGGLPGLFAAARAAGLTTSLDTQGDWSGEWAGGVGDVLGQSDLYFPNRDEATAIARSLGVAARDSVPVAELPHAFARLGTRAIVKCGAGGADALDGGEVVHADAIDLAPVDTVGAGDSFDAGYLYGHLRAWSVRRSLALAVACGSLSTRAAGGVDAQPTLEEALAAIQSAGLGVGPP